VRDPRVTVAREGCRPLPHQAAHKYLAREQPVDRSPDLARILALPRRPALETGDRAAELVEAVAARWRLPARDDCRCREIFPEGECLTDLNPAQARVLHEVSVRGAMAGLLAVGSGKTILDVMAAMALADHGVQTTVVLVPPRLQHRLVTEHRLLAEHWVVPSMVCDVEGYKAVYPGRPRVVVLSYSRLSRPNFSGYLRGLAPDAIVADEAHRLRNPKAATTMRVERYLDEHPWARFLWWTGSAEDGRYEDSAHLFRWALGPDSPAPLDDEVSRDWGRAANARKECADPGALFELCEPGEHVRRGLRRRKADTLGVVATHAPSSDVPVTISAMPDPELPPAVAEALEAVRKSWVRPDGEELVDALERAAVARDVACGFYLYWVFPRGESDAVIDRWLGVRKEWRREQRRKILRGEEDLDSPALVEWAAQRHHGRRGGTGPTWASDVWPEWDAVAGTVRPETRVAWIDDYLARDAARWVTDERGVCWYWRTAFGQRVAELAGVPMFGGGAQAARSVVREDGSRGIVVSAPAHGTGTDGLQYAFRQALLAQAPPGGWEQVIGRLARQGQRYPVEARYYAHTQELADARDGAGRRSDYAVDSGDSSLLASAAD
jgi:hypothetical protein